VRLGINRLRGVEAALQGLLARRHARRVARGAALEPVELRDEAGEPA
jgi:hypothetical protein